MVLKCAGGICVLHSDQARRQYGKSCHAIRAHNDCTRVTDRVVVDQTRLESKQNKTTHTHAHTRTHTHTHAHTHTHTHTRTHLDSLCFFFFWGGVFFSLCSLSLSVWDTRLEICSGLAPSTLRGSLKLPRSGSSEPEGTPRREFRSDPPEMAMATKHSCPNKETFFIWIKGRNNSAISRRGRYPVFNTL